MFEIKSLKKFDEENKKGIKMYRQKFLDMCSDNEQMNQFLAIYVVVFSELTFKLRLIYYLLRGLQPQLPTLVIIFKNFSEMQNF